MAIDPALKERLNNAFLGDPRLALGDAIEDIVSAVVAGEAADVITQSISNSDTTHAPSGDAVFDALALKQTAAYSPAVSGNWSPAPTTVAGALDQLAARVKALEP